MMRYTACLALLILVASAAAAEEGGDRPPLAGAVELGYRSVNVDGNENKYREDVNLPEGVRLFLFDLAYAPERNGALDELTLFASDLGGDPYSTVRFRARKFGRYDLKAEYRSMDFFYQDAGYFFSDQGDFHTWDTRRKFFDLDFRYQIARWFTLRAGANRKDRDGLSQTTRDVQRDVFPLNQPVDQTASEYWIGADFRIGWASLNVEQRFTTYENRMLLATEMANGADPGDAYLNDYRQFQVQDASAPVSRILFGGAPFERLRFNVGYARINSELDYDVEGDWDGEDYNGDAFQTSLINDGTVRRDYDLWDLELTYGILRNLDVSLDYYNKSYEQDGTIDYLEVQNGGDEEGTYPIQGVVNNSLSLDAVRLIVDWRPKRGLQFTGGVGQQTRDADFELAGPARKTERTLYRVGLRINPKPLWDLRLDYGTGSDDNPYTKVSPTDSDRIRASLRLRPGKGWNLLLHFKDDSRENNLSYPLGMATDDDPPATDVSLARFGVTAWGAALTCSAVRHVDFSIDYTRTEIESNVDLVYVNGETEFFPVIDIPTTKDPTTYIADQDVIRALARFEIGRAWTAGLSGVTTRNSGTLPLNWDRYRAWVRWLHRSGVSIRLQADRYELDEDNPYAGDPAALTPDVNNYVADLLTVALGYSF